LYFPWNGILGRREPFIVFNILNLSTDITKTWVRSTKYRFWPATRISQNKSSIVFFICTQNILHTMFSTVHRRKELP
jgi:hypothetical protein